MTRDRRRRNALTAIIAKKTTISGPKDPIFMRIVAIKRQKLMDIGTSAE